MPEWLSSVHHRLRALLRRRQFQRDIDDEMAFHVTMREEQLRRSGVADAAARASRRFGRATHVREDLREAWAFAPRLHALARDGRYALRTLGHAPGFTIVVILTLGLGIGANTAFFTVVNAVLVRPLGYAEADRLVSLEEGFPQARVDRLPFSALDFDDLRRDQRSFARVAAYRTIPFEVSGDTDGAPVRIVGAKVSAELFDTLGVGPAMGRTFSPADDRPGVHVAVLGWGLWQRRYGASPSILGQRIQLDREPYTVVGIMPAGFVFPRRGPRFNGELADVWVPIAFTERERAERGSMHLNSVIGRLKPDVSFETARAELDVLAQSIAARYPKEVRDAGFSPRLFAQPFRDAIAGRFETPLLLLLAAVGLVLLVACANVANLILSRTATRTREFAVRTALGARRSHLVHLLMCEALLLSAAGGVVGIAIAWWAVNAAPAVLTHTVPGLHDLAIDVRVLAFTAISCLATALIFALVPLPALAAGDVTGRFTRTPSRAAIRDASSRVTSGLGQLRLQRAFVIVTVSLACVLLVGAGLFMRSFAALVSTDVGFRPAHVLTASMTLPRSVYADAASVRTFHDALSRSLRALPGVRTVAIATDLPLTTYEMRGFAIDGATLSAEARRSTSLSWVHGPYFETLGMTLVRGRFFAADEYTQIRRVVIVNEKLAAMAWPGQDAIGKRIKWGAAAGPAPWLTVVGVIRNVADGPVGAEPAVHVYEPFRQLPDFFLNGATNQFGRDVKAAILAEGDPLALASLVRQEVSTLDRALAIDSVQTMDEQISEVIAPQRFGTLLVGAFAAMALGLASVGLYGLLAYTIAQRRKEIAVRMALGADRRAVVTMMIGHGARLVAIGFAAGVLGSLALVRVVAARLYQTSPYDLAAFAIVPAVLVPAAFLACAIPAWRAARVDPIQALRAD